MNMFRAILIALILASPFVLMVGGAKAEVTPAAIVVKVVVPDSAWKLTIEEVREVNGELWVVSRVSRDADHFGAQVITELKALVPVERAGRKVKFHVLGKTWNWEGGGDGSGEGSGDGSCMFIKNLGQLGKAYEQGRVLYPAAK